MKISADLFRSFVDKASLGGEILIININFKDNEVVSQVKDVTNVAMTKVVLSKDVFEDYSPLGEIYVKNTPLFLKYLDSFKDDIKIELTDDLVLKLSDATRKVYSNLTSESVASEYVVNKDFPEIKHNFKALMKKGDLTRTIKDLDVLKENEVIINVTETDLQFTVGDSTISDFISNKLGTFAVTDNRDAGKHIKIGIGRYFVSVYNVLDNDSDVELKLDNNVPIIFEETSEHMKFFCIVAPIIKED